MGPGEARDEHRLSNSFGASSLYQLVVIGRMWYNGTGQLIFTPDILAFWFGSQIAVRNPLVVRFRELGAGGGEPCKGGTFCVQNTYLFGLI